MIYLANLVAGCLTHPEWCPYLKLEWLLADSQLLRVIDTVKQISGNGKRPVRLEEISLHDPGIDAGLLVDLWDIATTPGLCWELWWQWMQETKQEWELKCQATQDTPVRVAI